MYLSATRPSSQTSRRGFIPQHNKLCAGFTLIEVTVVVAILVLLTSMLLVYNKTGEQQITIFREQVQLQNVISTAKALSIQTLNVGAVCGYGVHFTNQNTYVLYSSTDPSCATNSNPYAAAHTDLNSYTLDSRIVLSPLNVRDILFIPPDPKTILLSTSGVKQTDIVLSLRSVDGNAAASITMNDFGQISL